MTDKCEMLANLRYKKQIQTDNEIRTGRKLQARYWELPDGTKQSQPDVMGFMTYTKGFHNFNVYWKYAESKSLSISSLPQPSGSTIGTGRLSSLEA